MEKLLQIKQDMYWLKRNLNDQMYFYTKLVKLFRFNKKS